MNACQQKAKRGVCQPEKWRHAPNMRQKATEKETEKGGRGTRTRTRRRTRTTPATARDGDEDDNKNDNEQPPPPTAKEKEEELPKKGGDDAPKVQQKVGGKVSQPAGRFYRQNIGSKMCQPKAGRPRSSMVEHQRAPEVRPHSIRSVPQMLLQASFKHSPIQKTKITERKQETEQTETEQNNNSKNRGTGGSTERKAKGEQNSRRGCGDRRPVAEPCAKAAMTGAPNRTSDGGRPTTGRLMDYPDS